MKVNEQDMHQWVNDELEITFFLIFVFQKQSECLILGIMPSWPD